MQIHVCKLEIAYNEGALEKKLLKICLHIFIAAQGYNTAFITIITKH